MDNKSKVRKGTFSINLIFINLGEIPFARVVFIEFGYWYIKLGLYEKL